MSTVTPYSPALPIPEIPTQTILDYLGSTCLSPELTEAERTQLLRQSLISRVNRSGRSISSMSAILRPWESFHYLQLQLKTVGLSPRYLSRYLSDLFPLIIRDTL